MGDYFDSLRSATPARLEIGRAGSRYKTKAYLDFRAAHAAANDAVMSEVSKETLDDLGVFEIRTKCHDKYEMLTRGHRAPDDPPRDHHRLRRHRSAAG